MDVSTPFTNRRADSRRPPRDSVKVTCIKGTLGLGNNLARGVLDASETGVRLVLKSPLVQGAEIEVCMTGPTYGRPCKQIAEVAWCMPGADETYCVGARFLKRIRYRDVQDLCH